MAMFRTLTAERSVLIVLDNVRSAERVRPFVTGTRSPVLVTSRNQLRGLSARDGAHHVAVDTLPARDAVDLISARLRPDPAQTDPAAVVDLAECCAYLPLALRIAADQLRATPDLRVTDYVQQLRELGQIESLSIEDDERAQVETVFSWSYRALGEASARAFRFLGISPGRDMSLPAVGAYCGLDDGACRRVVHELVNCNLVSETSPGRYVLHDLLRAYASKLARRTDRMSAQDTATRRLINWYLATVDNANALVLPGRTERDDFARDPAAGRRFESYDQAMHWLEEERSNLVDITRRANEIGEHQAAAVMPNLLWGYFNVTKHWPEWIACNELGIASARAVNDRKSEAYLLTSQGVAYRNLRETELALDSHSAAIRLFEQLGDTVGLGYAQQNLANVLSDAGRNEEALPHYRRALDIFADAGEGGRGLAITLNSMAVCLQRMGRHTEALDTARRARHLMEAIDDAHGIAFAQNTIGEAEAGLGRSDEAVRAFDEALALRRRIGDRYGAAKTLLALGQAQADAGDAEGAARSWTSALDVFDELGAPERAEAEERLRRH
jgi:tetratricopeptide (TPR) repeat protein